MHGAHDSRARVVRFAAFALVSLVAAACSSSPGDGETTAQSVNLALGGSALPYRGTTLSCAEFGAQNLPGTFNTDYTYPTHAEVDYFVGKGMTALRIPFLWERMQPTAKGNLDAAQLAHLDDVVSYASSRGATVILDPHNYARYYGQVVGAGVGDDAFADFWSRMATHYASNARTIFALMNEPHDLPTEQWATAAQAAINSIRATGATNLILVPGNEWTGAHSWDQSFYGTPNAQAMLAVTDPGSNYAFEVHEYLDSDFSGTNPACVSSTYGSQNMTDFTAWLRQNGKRGFLGEFGGGANATCFAAVDDQLKFLEANSDVYLGWSWWAAGPWWGDYFLSIEPANGVDKPMMATLETHLAFSGGATTPPVAPPTTPPTAGGGAKTGTGSSGSGSGSGSGSSSGSGSGSSSGSTSTTGSNGLTASLTITNDWGTGYCADVHVTNGGSQAVGTWTLTLDAKSSTLNQAWNVQVVRSGSTYTMTPVAWNAPIAAGATADWGFCAEEAGDHGKGVVTGVE